MDGMELQCIEVEIDLGVYVDKELKFEQHINETEKSKEEQEKKRKRERKKKKKKKAGMITHYIQYKHKEITVPLFKSLVRPILEYGNAVCALIKKN